jgi:hypothetical protein
VKDLIKKAIQLERSRRESMNLYQKYLEPLADAIDRGRGILGNLLFPNSRPKDIGWFRSGKPSILRIIQSEAHGWMNENDFKIFKRRIVNTRRDYRFTLIIDQSGSMAGEKKDRSMQSMVYFIEVLEYLKIPYEIIGYSDSPSVYKSFEEGMLDEEGRYALVETVEVGAASGGTNGRAALIAIDPLVTMYFISGGGASILIRMAISARLMSIMLPTPSTCPCTK